MGDSYGNNIENDNYTDCDEDHNKDNDKDDNKDHWNDDDDNDKNDDSFKNSCNKALDLLWVANKLSIFNSWHCNVKNFKSFLKDLCSEYLLHWVLLVKLKSLPVTNKRSSFTKLHSFQLYTVVFMFASTSTHPGKKNADNRTLVFHNSPPTTKQ